MASTNLLGGGLRADDCEPTDWHIVFHAHSPKRWIRWLAMGRFKHVSCFGFVERAQSWVFFEFHLDRTRIMVVGDHEADIMIGEFIHGNTVVRLAKPLGQELNINMTAGAWCVPAVAHIVGVKSCALRPDAFFRQCLAKGGELLFGEGVGNEAENRSSQA